MANIFITGSADGLGKLAAQALIAQGHSVTLHARNDERARDVRKEVPGAKSVAVGDLSDMEQTKNLADAVNKEGPFDAVIHNAGVYRASANDILTVNVLAPYILTCLITGPQRLVYLSSGMHQQGLARLDAFRPGTREITYSDSKLHIVMLALAIARKWPDVYSNAVDPGWVPTRMGGSSAPDDLQKGFETQAWLAVSDDAQAMVTGRYFFHKKEKPYNPEAAKIGLQEKLLDLCAAITGIAFPGSAA